MGYNCGYSLPNDGGTPSAYSTLSCDRNAGYVTHIVDSGHVHWGNPHAFGVTQRLYLCRGLNNDGTPITPIVSLSWGIGANGTLDVIFTGNGGCSISTLKSIINFLGGFNWYQVQENNGVVYESGVMTCGQAFGGIHNNTAPVPVTPTFTLSNVYDGYDSIKLHITSSGLNTTSYDVYRSNTSGGTYSFKGNFIGTDYVDNTVTTGNTYWYKVNANGGCWDVYSTESGLLSQSVVDETCVIRNLATITNPTSGDTTSKYELWRSTTENGVYQRVGHSDNASPFVYDKVTDYGQTYWYRVNQVTPYWTLSGVNKTQVISVASMPDAPLLTGVINTGSTSIDLSWTDTNTWHQQYEIWKQTAGGGYTLIATTTGNTYHAVIGTNIVYDFKVRGKIDCFNPTFIYSPFSNEVTYSITPVIFPPINVYTDTISCTGGTIHWTNVNVSGQTGNYIKEFDGISGYTIIATLSSGATSYNFTGLQPISTHQYSVWAFNIGRQVKSVGTTLTTLNPAPFNLNESTSYLSAYFTWDINDSAYGQSIRPEIRVVGAGNWTTKPLLAHNATSYTFTGLTFNTDYEVRFVRIGSEYPSDEYYFSTADFLAPSGLTVTSIGDKQICLSWINNTINDNIDVWYRKEAEAWQVYETVSNITDSICITGLSMLTLYTFSVANNYGSYSEFSNQVQATTTVTFLPPFCENEAYNVSDATCGNADGLIWMIEDYTIFYDFMLHDVYGNFYTLTDYYYSGLTAGWYFLSASPKPKWNFYYNGDVCSIDWIKVEDSNSSMYLHDVKIRPMQCQPFDRQFGRIFYDVSGITAGHTWNFEVFTLDLKQYYHKTGITTNEDFILNNATAQCYYGVITDEVSGCHLLLDLQCVPSVPFFSIGGIKKLWITPWTADLDYNYWTTKDDDYFVEFADVSFFLSTKIKNYSLFGSMNLQWYSLPVAPKIVKVSQKLDKVRQGFVFTDNLDIAISEGNASKWTQMATLINPENRWVYVVQDDNGFYWTGGYRHGARITAYSFKTGAREEDNGYGLTITAVSENKLLTNLDEDYVKNNIL